MDAIVASKLFIIAATLTFFYIIDGAIYRLYLSPIARFPGPKIAALTGWYEFYYDIPKKGSYLYEIEKMHRKYGPIVRVNPYELSIDDPEYYNELYVTASTRQTDAYEQFGNGLNLNGDQDLSSAHILTKSHSLHRRRRRPLEPFFSRMGVTHLEPMLADCCHRLCDRIEEFKGTSTIVRLDHAFAALTGDVMSKICCEEDTNFIEDAEFTPSWFNLINATTRAAPVLVQLSFLITPLYMVPKSVMGWLNPKYRAVLHYEEMTRQHIAKAKSDKEKGIDVNSRPTLFRHIVNSEMPESELHEDRLTQEGQTIIGAGTISTARALDFMSYHIIANERIRTTLKEELVDIMAGYPDKVPTWAELEKLPYLTAIIKEGLRLTYGVMHRLPRVSPDTALVYKDWTIPPGVPVGMSAYFMHNDPTIFPDPFTFRPERWLGDINPLMARNYVPFTRGSRNCLGINVAYAELNIMLAYLFRPNGPTFELFETDETDVIPIHDFIAPLPKLDTKGVRVIVR